MGKKEQQVPETQKNTHSGEKKDSLAAYLKFMKQESALHLRKK